MSEESSEYDALVSILVIYCIFTGFAFCIYGLGNDNTDYITVGVTIILATITGHYAYTTKKILNINEESLNLLYIEQIKEKINEICNKVHYPIKTEINNCITSLKYEDYIGIKRGSGQIDSKFCLYDVLTAKNLKGIFINELKQLNINQSFPEPIFQKYYSKTIRELESFEINKDFFINELRLAMDTISTCIGDKNRIQTKEMVILLLFHEIYEQNPKNIHRNIGLFEVYYKEYKAEIIKLKNEPTINESLQNLSDIKEDLLKSLNHLNNLFEDWVYSWSYKYMFTPKYENDNIFYDFNL